MSLLAIAAVLGFFGTTPFDEPFARGCDAYERGDFSAAIDAFERLADEGVAHPALFYNLGNAHLRAGRTGLAIAHYERALLLQPDFPDAVHNLQWAVARTRGRVPRPVSSPWRQALLFWGEAVDPRALHAGGLLAWVGFWIVLMGRRRHRFRFSGHAAAALLMAAIALGAAAWFRSHPAPMAVVIAYEAEARTGPSPRDPVCGELYEGDRVRVTGRRATWTRVRIVGDGASNQGWVRNQDVIVAGLS